MTLLGHGHLLVPRLGHERLLCLASVLGSSIYWANADFPCGKYSLWFVDFDVRFRLLWQILVQHLPKVRAIRPNLLWTTSSHSLELSRRLIQHQLRGIQKWSPILPVTDDAFLSLAPVLLLPPSFSFLSMNQISGILCIASFPLIELHAADVVGVA